MPTRTPTYYLVLKDFMTVDEVKHSAGAIISLPPTDTNTLKYLDQGYITLYDAPAPHPIHL